MSPHNVTIELVDGYVDKKNARHSTVVFGQRLHGKVFFTIDEDPQSDLPTQYNDLLLRAAITHFGALSMPVPLSVLLSLSDLDREDLSDAYNRFSIESLDGRRADFLSDNKVKLPFGYERNGLVYDIVEFGTRLTGMDSVEADRLKLGDLRRGCFLAGKQVVRLAQSEGASALEGPMLLEMFETLDVADLNAIRQGAELWRQSFRRARATVPQRGSTQRPAAG